METGIDGDGRKSECDGMGLSDNMRGAVFMAVAMAGFVVNDAMMKSLSGEVPLFQAIFVRGLFATALVAAFAWRLGAIRRGALARVDRGWAALRVVAEIGTTTCFLQALFNMPIANATAILQATPLAITLAAAIFLRERVGWRRWSAIGAGFLGVLMIVQPGGAGFDDAAIWAVAAVGFIVVRDLVTRRLSPATPSIFITMMTAVSITCLGAVVSLFFEWEPVAGGSVGVMAGAAVFLFCGYFFSVATMRVGELSFSAPFRYSILIWSLLLGWLVFDETPNALALAGTALVVVAGLYTFYREQRLD